MNHFEKIYNQNNSSFRNKEKAKYEILIPGASDRSNGGRFRKSVSETENKLNPSQAYSLFIILI